MVFQLPASAQSAALSSVAFIRRSPTLIPTMVITRYWAYLQLKSQLIEPGMSNIPRQCHCQSTSFRAQTAMSKTRRSIILFLVSSQMKPPSRARVERTIMMILLCPKPNSTPKANFSTSSITTSRTRPTRFTAQPLNLGLSLTLTRETNIASHIAIRVAI